ncbi:hypothetical protein XENOCAPTIV_002942 [Xenoophorus captivus]|uniref:Uncharacterized protein n=1 Tax=Xenoophorus captivus TaxID=1517983 RepID=A0ABV0QCK4_9TELE
MHTHTHTQDVILGTLIDEVIHLALKQGREKRAHQRRGEQKMSNDVRPNLVADQGWKHAAHICGKSLIRGLLKVPDVINMLLISLCFISWCLIKHFSTHRLQSPDFDLAPITAAPNWAEAYHGPPLVDERMTHEMLTPVMTQTR